MLPVALQNRFKGELAAEHPLAPLTTWRIGGPAELYLEPASPEELADAVHALWRIGMPYRVLGGGSNLLVPDRGVRGAVLSLARLRGVHFDEEIVVAEAGALLHQIVSKAAEWGCGGLEALAGIPGQLGGAIFGNAGSRLGSISEVAMWIDLMDEDGTLERVVPDGQFFRYRASKVGTRVVVRAGLAVRPDDATRLQESKHEMLRERLATQPGWIGNAGCVFKNPDGDSAGRLIDAAGCKGWHEGPVAVSAIHANFFENAGGGRAEDVRKLTDRVRAQVDRQFGVELRMEVRRWD